MAHCPSAVALRVKLPRGLDDTNLEPPSTSTSTEGEVVVIGLCGRAAKDALLQVGDRIQMDATQLKQLRDQRKCEVTLVRDDATLMNALRSHGMLDKRNGDAVPCFLLLKLPLRHEAERSDDLETDGLRVTAVHAMALADALIHVGDLIVGLNGQRVDRTTITSALGRPTAAPMRVFTVLRPCPQHDVPFATSTNEPTDPPKHDSLAAALQRMDEAVALADSAAVHAADAVDAMNKEAPPAAATPNPVPAPPPPSSAPHLPNAFMAEDEKAHNKTVRTARAVALEVEAEARLFLESVASQIAGVNDTEESPALSAPALSTLALSEAPTSELEEAPSPHKVGPSTRLYRAKATTLAATSFEPLKREGVWSDLPDDDTDSNGVYDSNAGVWSDVPLGATSRAPRTAVGTVQMTNAALDTIIKQATQGTRRRAAPSSRCCPEILATEAAWF